MNNFIYPVQGLFGWNDANHEYFEICMVSREKHPAIEVHAILMLVETAEFITWNKNLPGYQL